MLELKVKTLSDAAKLPTKAHPSDAGFDLYALHTCFIGHAEIYKVSTGIAVEIPEGYCGLIFDRSSLGSNGIFRLAGVIDSSYRGEIMVCLSNISQEQYKIKSGDKVAQLLIMPVPDVEVTFVTELSQTQRGSGGFGSTGK